MPDPLPRIALPIGDPAGIGPEIVLKALGNADLRQLCEPVVVGSPADLRLHAIACSIDVQIESDRVVCADFPPVTLVAVTDDDDGNRQFGRVDARCGSACVGFARQAVELARAGNVAAVVAGPHTEESVNLAGISFDGYPGLVADLTETDHEHVFLMLLSSVFRIVNTTLHLPLADAITRLDAALIGRAIAAADTALRQMGIPVPRIGVCGLNPHAGENGLFGTEDDEIVRPAVDAARALGLDVTGPAGADALLAKRAHDVYVALYHDQGHIPIKVTTPHASSAITIGTPILFGSVAHGSAHDIAGQGRASEAALVDAVSRLAAQFGVLKT